MTYNEYVQKRERIAVSLAPIEEIEAAIKELDKKYNASNSLSIAQQQYNESLPDLNDIGGQD